MAQNESSSFFGSVKDTLRENEKQVASYIPTLDATTANLQAAAKNYQDVANYAAENRLAYIFKGLTGQMDTQLEAQRKLEVARMAAESMQSGLNTNMAITNTSLATAQAQAQAASTRELESAARTSGFAEERLVGRQQQRAALTGQNLRNQEFKVEAGRNARRFATESKELGIRDLNADIEARIQAFTKLTPARLEYALQNIAPNSSEYMEYAEAQRRQKLPLQQLQDAQAQTTMRQLAAKGAVRADQEAVRTEQVAADIREGAVLRGEKTAMDRVNEWATGAKSKELNPNDPTVLRAVIEQRELKGAATRQKDVEEVKDFTVSGQKLTLWQQLQLAKASTMRDNELNAKNPIHAQVLMQRRASALESQKLQIAQAQQSMSIANDVEVQRLAAQGNPVARLEWQTREQRRANTVQATTQAAIFQGQALTQEQQMAYATMPMQELFQRARAGDQIAVAALGKSYGANFVFDANGNWQLATNEPTEALLSAQLYANDLLKQVPAQANAILAVNADVASGKLAPEKAVDILNDIRAEAARAANRAGDFLGEAAAANGDVWVAGNVMNWQAGLANAPSNPSSASAFQAAQQAYTAAPVRDLFSTEKDSLGNMMAKLADGASKTSAQVLDNARTAARQNFASGAMRQWEGGLIKAVNDATGGLLIDKNTGMVQPQYRTADGQFNYAAIGQNPDLAAAFVQTMERMKQTAVNALLPQNAQDRAVNAVVFDNGVTEAAANLYDAFITRTKRAMTGAANRPQGGWSIGRLLGLTGDDSEQP